VDGLRHFAYQKEAKFYNGVTLDDMFREDRKKKWNVKGIEKWEEKGIVGRDISIDYNRWRCARGLEYIAMLSNSSATPLSLEHLKAALK
jgi:hypothetical protein